MAVQPVGAKAPSALQQEDVGKATSKPAVESQESPVISTTVKDLLEKLLKDLDADRAEETTDKKVGAPVVGDDIQSTLEELMKLIAELIEMLIGFAGGSSNLSQDSAKPADGAGKSGPGTPQAMPAEAAAGQPAGGSPSSGTIQAMPAEGAGTTSSPVSKAPTTENGASIQAMPAEPTSSKAAATASAPAGGSNPADANLTKLFENAKAEGYTTNELGAINQLTGAMLGSGGTTAKADATASAATTPTSQPSVAPSTATNGAESVYSVMSKFIDKSYEDGKLDDNELKAFQSLTAQGTTGISGGSTGTTPANGLRAIDGVISNSAESATHLFGGFLSGAMMTQVYSILDKAAMASPEDKFA